MKINIGLSAAEIKTVVAILRILLADKYVLYTKARKYHWNVVSGSFSELHKFFEGIYEALNEQIDEIAERIRQLGEESPGTLAEFLKDARLQETPGKNPNDKGMIKDLLEDFETTIQTLRKDVEICNSQHDAGTADFLTALMEADEKTAWMLRSYV